MNPELKITFNMQENPYITHYVISKVDYYNLMNACKETIVKPVMTEMDKVRNVEAHSIIATLKMLEPVKYVGELND